MTISNHLELDVVRFFDQFLYVHTTVTESFLGFDACRVEPLHQAHIVVRRPHPATAAAGGRLDHYRITDLLSDLEGLTLGSHHAVAARRNRHPSFTRGRPSRILVLHHSDCECRWADELDVTALADFSKMRVLG